MKKMFGILGLLLLSTVVRAQESDSRTLEMKVRDEERCVTIYLGEKYRYQAAQRELNSFLEYGYSFATLQDIESKLLWVMRNLWLQEQNKISSLDLVSLKNNFKHWTMVPSLRRYVLSMGNVFNNKAEILKNVENALPPDFKDYITLKSVPELMHQDGTTRVCLLIHLNKIDKKKWPVSCYTIDIKEDARFASKNMKIQRFFFQKNGNEEEYLPLTFKGIDFNRYPTQNDYIEEKLLVAQCPLQ